MQSPSLDGWAAHLEGLAGAERFEEWPPEALLRPARRREDDATAGEVELWRGMRRGGPMADLFARAAIDPAGSGPLWPISSRVAIEVWTEAELCGLHGLRRARRLAGKVSPLLDRRIASAANWHMEHTQPDHATGRPWALHVFLLEGSPEARCYAETLLHNAEVQGLAEAETRWILADAARELRLAT